MKISYQVEKKYLFDGYEELVSSSSREWTLEDYTPRHHNSDGYALIHRWL